MAFGDVGGPVTELICTVKMADGIDRVPRGTPVVPVYGRNYVVEPAASLAEWFVHGIGQTMAEFDRDDHPDGAVPIKLRGIARMRDDGSLDQQRLKPGDFIPGRQWRILSRNIETSEFDVLL